MSEKQRVNLNKGLIFLAIVIVAVFTIYGLVHAVSAVIKIEGDDIEEIREAISPVIVESSELESARFGFADASRFTTSTVATSSMGDETQVEVLAKNPRRVYAAMVNNSSSTLYLCLVKRNASTSCDAGRGIRLNADGGSFEIGAFNYWDGPVYAATNTSSSTISVFEGSMRR